MQLADFDFALPAELIAQEPVRPAERARLLLIGERPADRRVADLPSLLRPGDLLLVNDTAVLPTRFWGRRGDVAVEVTLVEPEGEASWWALCRPGRRLRPGDPVELAPDLVGTVERKDDEGRALLGFAQGGAALLAAIRAHGAMPLPPYIRRAPGGDPRDRERYQPVFARVPGSVASPTASLHFTAALLDRLRAAGIGMSSVTLHVGQGTFAPVKADDIRAHRMHEEWFELPAETVAAVAATRAAGGRVVAVGTTVLRALESAVDVEGRLRSGTGRTAIFITPGWRFATADLLLTNFHLPRSTLFMLVCAFGGIARLRTAYAHAIAKQYRFFSYGDACLIERDGG